MRLVLHMMNRDEGRVKEFAEALVAMRQGVQPCGECHNPTEDAVCSICSNVKRDLSTLCVVEDVRDLLALEAMGEYRACTTFWGYHRPMDGVGPADLTVRLLGPRPRGRGERSDFALPSSMEGDTTAFYVSKRLTSCDVLLTAAVGEALQYDAATLSSLVESFALQPMTDVSVVIVSYNVRAFSNSASSRWSASHGLDADV